MLVVEDEETLRQEVLCRLLRREGYNVLEASNGAEALRLLEGTDVDLILSDVRMEPVDGLELLGRVRDRGLDVPFILITAYSSEDKAIDALRKGAYDFLKKPFMNDELLIRVRNGLANKELFQENRTLKRELRDRYSFENIIGKSDAMAAVFQLIEKVAETPSNVLLTGESGTGKELVARAIHYHSEREAHPFVAVNCGAFVETLLESELFGHVRGAFTGAVANKRGVFEQADGGTLFLDEISDIPLAMQVKLLRAVQEREVVPVGGSQRIRFDIRLIAATNRNLEQEVQAGRFREDLYYRINVVQVSLPPLRARRDDIPLLARYFLKRCGEAFHRPGASLSQEAMRCLVNYDWPGNVRELENVVERGMTLAEGSSIEPWHLPEKLRQVEQVWEEGPQPTPSLEEVERAHIAHVLEQVHWNKNQAAKVLGINLSTLYRKIGRYQLRLTH
ncbi:MAG: sigma-54-dependent Fis family transcriptional regulator [Candidatus Tectomicrobia bacterium]|nr:sigma-54-dependent Fis family transcriptional regulator [Candidatus Tectomicrobia bacterium]